MNTLPPIKSADAVNTRFENKSNALLRRREISQLSIMVTVTEVHHARNRLDTRVQVIPFLASVFPVSSDGPFHTYTDDKKNPTASACSSRDNEDDRHSVTAWQMIECVEQVAFRYVPWSRLKIEQRRAIIRCYRHT